MMVKIIPHYPPCVVKCYQHSKKKCASGWTNRKHPLAQYRACLTELGDRKYHTRPLMEISTPPNALTRWGVC